MEVREYLLAAMAERPREKADPALDAATVLDAAGATYTLQALRSHAATVLNLFAETTDDDLDAGETLADRLQVLLLSEADEDGDGEVGDGEEDLLQGMLEAAGQYLARHGIADDDIDELLNNWSDDAALRVRDALAEALPDGDAGIDAFAFGDDATAPLFDGVMRKLVSFSHGVKTAIMKRVSGVAKRMTPKQRAAFAKVRRKSHTSSANRMRKLSIGKRIKSGIGMKRKRA